MRRRHLLLLPLNCALLGLGFLAGFWMPHDDDFFAIRKNFEIFSSLYEELATGYVDELDPEKLMRSGVEAMLSDLDPYTTYVTEAENTELDIITRGRYAGVGLNVGRRGGKLTVISPVEGTSGYRQGVRTGDVLLEVAGQPADKLTSADLSALLRGEPGTAVDIVLEREGEPEPLRFTLMREEVQLKNVTYSGFVGDDTLAGIGYVKLERFAREATAEVRRSVQELQQTGKLKSIVIDLRDNPGGLLEAAVEITGLFVPQNSVIVSTKGRMPQTDRTYRTGSTPLAPDLPLVVLANGYSASASEIVAGALQDLDRAVIVGETSFGKGLVQLIRPLPYNTSLKMTTSRYYTPSGRSIQALDYGQHDGSASEIPDSLRRTFRTAAGREVRDGGGIEPDLPVERPEVSELEEALERRAAFFFFANHYAATHPTIPQKFTVTDEVLDAFRTWLEAESFTYRTDAEQTAFELAGELERMGYVGTEDEIQALEEAIRAEKAADLERHREDLKQRLWTEILARYYGQAAQIRASLLHDPAVLAAVDLLMNTNDYEALLSPERR